MTDTPGSSDHEQIVFCHDRATGLRAIVGIHSTALGAALGGTRFYPYASTEAAVADVMRLSRAMSYKNAVAGLPHGGGKAVIIGDPTTDKSPELLHAYGRFIESLGGRYVTAADVGTFVADMDTISATTRWATGRSTEHGGAGDSSVLTAFGVFQGMRAAAEQVWGEPTLAGRTVGISGVGKVGRHLAEHLVSDGARLVVADVNAAAVAGLKEAHPDRVEVVADSRAVTGASIDVYAPCALGGALDDATVEQLSAAIVCGAANNQLAHEGTAARLAERGVLYAPDFVVNAGGVIQVGDELLGFDFDRAKAKTAQIFDQTTTVLTAAAAQGVLPAVAADRLAEERMAAGARTLFLGPHHTAEHK